MSWCFSIHIENKIWKIQVIHFYIIYCTANCPMSCRSAEFYQSANRCHHIASLNWGHSVDLH